MQGNNQDKKTGVVDSKRCVAQSVSGKVTHTNVCHVYRMDACRCMQHDSCDTGTAHIKIVLESVIPFCQV